MLTKLYTRGGNEFLLIFWAWCPNSYGTYTTNLHTRHMYSIILICQHCQNWCDDADITNNILVINFSWQRFNADVVGGGGTLAKTDIWEWERSKERWLASLRSWFSFYFSAKLMLFSCEMMNDDCPHVHSCTWYVRWELIALAEQLRGNVLRTFGCMVLLLALALAQPHAHVNVCIPYPFFCKAKMMPA